MSIVNKGFRGRRAESARQLPPGQHLTADFPVLQAGPTPRIDLDDWRFTIRDERGAEHVWTWAQLKLLPSERLTVDIHCVTTWSKLDTKWEGVSLDTLFESVDTTAEFALVGSYGGYTTNIPVADLLGGKAWIVYGYQGEPLSRGAWWPGAAAGAASVFLEVREVGAIHRVARQRHTRILGAFGLSQLRRPVARTTLRRGLTRGRWFDTEVAVAGCAGGGL